MGLYGQSRIDRQDFEEEGQLTLECVFHLGAQAGGEVGDPLAQRGLRDPVVFDLGIAFWVGTHPQLEETTVLSVWSVYVHSSIFKILVPMSVGEGKLKVTEVSL